MKHLTIRNVSSGLEKALQAEKRRRGTSLNQTVIELLQQSLGLGHERRRSNGLEKLAGTWTKEELREFERATEMTRRIDEELWADPTPPKDEAAKQ